MAAPLSAGQEWEARYRELPGGSYANLSPNPATNPFYIPADDTKCYQVGVRKKCGVGIYGQWQMITVGACDEDAPNTNFFVFNNSTTGAVIDDLDASTGPTPYTIASGSLPMGSAAFLMGNGSHTGTWDIDISSFTVACRLTAYINTVVVDQIDITGTGTFTTGVITWAAGDILEFFLDSL